MGIHVTIVLLCCLLVMPDVPVSHGAPLAFKPEEINRTCKYRAYNVPPELFFNGTKGPGYWTRIFPLSRDGKAASEYYKDPWKACWGPGEFVKEEDIVAQKRLPCSWSKNATTGGIDYSEEFA